MVGQTLGRVNFPVSSHVCQRSGIDPIQQADVDTGSATTEDTEPGTGVRETAVATRLFRTVDLSQARDLLHEVPYLIYPSPDHLWKLYSLESTGFWSKLNNALLKPAGSPRKGNGVGSSGRNGSPRGGPGS